VGCAIIIMIAIIFGSGALYIVYLNTLGVQTQAAERRVTQQSLQYIQAHQQILMTYWSDYQTGDAAHQATYQILICQQAPLLDQGSWPTQITAFVSQHCN
jgi:archaellum component FlaF (FlaF/FlaG flagellin family)